MLWVDRDGLWLRVCCTGHVEKSEDAEFARRLPGAGPEALLGAAEGAIRAGRCGKMRSGAQHIFEIDAKLHPII